jgi:hypothetical protein
MENKDDIEFLELYNKAVNVMYEQYEGQHSLQTTMHYHPMFYNGTVCKDNDCAPDLPDPLISFDEFKTKCNDDEKLNFALQTLISYMYRVDHNMVD